MKKLDEKKVDENREITNETKSDNSASTFKQTDTSRERLIAEQLNVEASASTDSPVSKAPAKNWGENWDDLGDEAPGSRIRLY